MDFLAQPPPNDGDGASDRFQIGMQVYLWKERVGMWL